MATPSQTYVDPAIAADSGTGTIGDPYGDLQYALDTMTRDGANGDQINVKAGTDEVLVAAIDLTTYGTPTVDAPLIFRGYTSAANDGGIGGVSGNASVSVFNSSTLDAIIFIDMHLHNTGANPIIRVDGNSIIWNCEINNSTSGAALDIGSGSFALENHIHDFEGAGINLRRGFAIGNFIDADGATPTNGIDIIADRSFALNNIIKCSVAMNGVQSWPSTVISGNSIYNGASGTGFGIDSRSDSVIITNNIVEGFSGVGGVGINLDAGDDLNFVDSNAVFDCATAYSLSSDTYWGTNNDTLSASPFADPGNDDFSVNTDPGVKADGFPADWSGSATTNFLDKGAAQRASTGAFYALRRIPI